MRHRGELSTMENKRHLSLSILNDKSFVIMGIVNITPDSFSDGGEFLDPDAAAKHAMQLIQEGADVLDIGAESSRPGAEPVSEEEELRRILPVIKKIREQTGIPLSVDTTKANVAACSLDAGADWINDISAGRFDASMAPLVAKRQCPVVLMHSRKTPVDMQQNPTYTDVVSEVCQDLVSSVNLFCGQGVLKEHIIIDPGIGFAKRFEDNLAVLGQIHRIIALGFPVLLGTSRKSFIGTIVGKTPRERLIGSLASIAGAYRQGVRIFRVHDVGASREFLQVLSAIEKNT